jgi:predicted house-cleaning noncanonical NTP pyrophosphatase (MazG superfamily)
MAYSDKNREKDYQFNYHKNYKPKMLQKLKDELKALSEQQDIEAYMTEYILIFSDIDQCTSTALQITWYRFLIKFIQYRLVR